MLYTQMAKSTNNPLCQVKAGDCYIKMDMFADALKMYLMAEKSLLVQLPEDEAEFNEYYSLMTNLYTAKAKAYKGMDDMVQYELATKRASSMT